MKIVQIAAEITPHAKVGGLADVVSALSRALAGLHHDVHVFLPFYKAMENAGAHDLKHSVSVPSVNGKESVDLWGLMHNDVNLVLLRHDASFWRPGIYGEGGEGYKDNLQRYALFSRASLEAVKALSLSPDIIHCHDWHTSLVPVYHKTMYSGDFPKTATVLTIHNLGYQGIFPSETFPLLGLPRDLFTPQNLEFYGNVNILKGGVLFSHAITAVSPTYALEIQTPEFGYGLEGVLRDRSRGLHGILNGIDVNEWNPKTDALLPARYDMRSFKGKAQCKSSLQESLGLDKDPGSLLAGMITRLVEQKGINLVLDVMDDIASLGIQVVILGNGEKKYEEALKEKARRHHGRVGVRIAFDNPLAHLIEAGSEVFLMPSQYEPCGLNQMMSLRYGTVPVVRSTGGLKDTIHEFDPSTGRGNGFVFQDFTSQAFFSALKRALGVYKNQAVWKTLVKNGMKEDNSWTASAQSYASLYEKLLR